MNHYLAERFAVSFGKDTFAYAAYNGKIGYATVVLGKGAYDEENKFDKPVPFEEGKQKLNVEKETSEKPPS